MQSIKRTLLRTLITLIALAGTFGVFFLGEFLGEDVLGWEDKYGGGLALLLMILGLTLWDSLSTPGMSFVDSLLDRLLRRSSRTTNQRRPGS